MNFFDTGFEGLFEEAKKEFRKFCLIFVLFIDLVQLDQTTVETFVMVLTLSIGRGCRTCWPDDTVCRDCWDIHLRLMYKTFRVWSTTVAFGKQFKKIVLEVQTWNIEVLNTNAIPATQSWSFQHSLPYYLLECLGPWLLETESVRTILIEPSFNLIDLDRAIELKLQWIMQLLDLLWLFNSWECCMIHVLKFLFLVCFVFA